MFVMVLILDAKLYSKMSTRRIIPCLTDFWDLLSPTWKKVLAQNLDLEGFFTINELEYILTLTELDCGGAEIQELFPILYMPQLEKLDISDNPIRDFSPLAELSQLKELSATFCDIKGWGKWDQLPSLEVLDVSYSLIHPESLTHLSELPNLKELYVNGCGVKSVSGLNRMEDLKVLSAFFNCIPTVEIDIFKQLRPECKVLW